MSDNETHEYQVRLTEEEAGAYQANWPDEPEGNPGPYTRALYAFVNAIREQRPKPKPEEPKEFGAVVRDKDGHLWVRADDIEDYEWFSPSGDGVWRTYGGIDAVEVVRDGVA